MWRRRGPKPGSCSAHCSTNSDRSRTILEPTVLRRHAALQPAQGRHAADVWQCGTILLVLPKLIRHASEIHHHIWLFFCYCKIQNLNASMHLFQILQNPTSSHIACISGCTSCRWTLAGRSFPCCLGRTARARTNCGAVCCCCYAVSRSLGYYWCEAFVK